MDMDPELARIAARQGGVFTRSQASAAGYRSPALRKLTSPGGAWVVVRRGIYADRETWDRLDPYRGRRLIGDWAAQLAVSVEHVLSHDSAARAWDLPLLRPAQELAHITRPGVCGTRTEHGIKHHLEKTALDAAYDLAGLPVTSLERTAVDVAREHGWLHGLVAMDGALQKGADVRAMEAICDSMKYWPGVTRVRRALRLALPGSESAGESLTRRNVAELGLGTVVSQFPVRVGRGTAWCDLLVGCHVFEFDGRRKYRDVTRGGYAERPIEEVIWDEKVRERDVASQGLGISRVFWNDCLGAGRDEGLRRMAADFAASCRRFGTVPPRDVTAYAEQMWEARARRLRRSHVVLPPRLALEWKWRAGKAA